MAGPIDSVMKVLFPKRFKPDGNAQTNTYSPDRTGQVLSAPTYREHLTDIFTSRASNNSKDLLQQLFIHDPDVSAAVNAFLTVADTEPMFLVFDRDGKFDRKGAQVLNQILSYLTTRYDYSKGFLMKQSIRTVNESMRYMLLLRGGIAGELVFDKTQTPSELRLVDIATLRWYETASNHFVPEQLGKVSNVVINLDIPSFFATWFRKDPTTIHPHSVFVSAINTVAARQQVINDLYRIMQITGYPRLEATIVEEILLKSAPAEVKASTEKQLQYVGSEMANIQSLLANTTADQALVHTDSVQMKVLNDKAPSNALNIDSVIGALNAMNQAGLRSMATILGRGESGVNTASVEARVFSMNAQALNTPLSEFWSQCLTMALRVIGNTDSRVECRFRPVELRPETELEPQMIVKQSRLLQDLSLGIIDDDEYHLSMHGRIRPDSAPILTATGFYGQQAQSTSDTASQVSPNTDPVGRSVTPAGSKVAKSKTVSK